MLDSFLDFQTSVDNTSIISWYSNLQQRPQASEKKEQKITVDQNDRLQFPAFHNLPSTDTSIFDFDANRVSLRVGHFQRVVLCKRDRASVQQTLNLMAPETHFLREKNSAQMSDTSETGRLLFIKVVSLDEANSVA